MKKMRLERTFWPVGHGAFYTEKFGGRVTVVYDCGSGLAPVRNIGGKDVSPKDVADWVNVFLPPKKDEDGNVIKDIDLLFISHFHADHINGVPALLPRVKRLVLPYFSDSMLLEALIYNAISTNDISFRSDTQNFILNLAIEQRNLRNIITKVKPRDNESPRDRDWNPEGQDVEIDNDEETILSVQNLGAEHTSGEPIVIYRGKRHVPFWKYVPVNVGFDERKGKVLLNKLIKGLDLDKKEIIVNGKIQWLVLASKLSTANIITVYDIYTNVFGKKDQNNRVICNHNAYSMPVFSGPYGYLAARDLHSHIGIAMLNKRKHLYRYCDMDFHRLRSTFDEYYPYADKLLSCLYMGDYEAKPKKKLKALIDELQTDYYRAGLQQAPHHFSIWNHNKELYHGRLMTFGNVEDDKEVNANSGVISEIKHYACAPNIIRKNDYPTMMGYWLHY